jgi:hypothetical protein
MNDTATPATQADATEVDTAVIPDEGTSDAEVATETAEASANETQPDPTGEGETSDGPDPELIEWAKKKGIPVDDPNGLSPAALKAIEVARNGEKDFHESRQQAKSKLKEEAAATVNADDYTDPLQAEVQQMKTGLMVRDFYDANPEAKAFDAEMAEIVKARPYLAQDLEAAYALVKSGKSKAELEAAEKKGREAAKAEIARSSSAVMPKGNASGTTPKDETDPGLAAFNKAYDQY